jgi:Zn-dependent protease with chaperone function
MKDKGLNLNPFIYLSETDIRFYMLVLIGIIIPTLWAAIFGMVLFSVETQLQMSVLTRLLIISPIIVLIPLLIYWQYTRYPKKIIGRSQLKEFDGKKFPDQVAFLERLKKDHLPDSEQPMWMYQPLDPSVSAQPVSAFTFGVKNHRYIGFSAGLLTKKFRNNIDGFKSIVLHEFGHIANRDVEKAYLADATWRILLIALLVPVAIFILFQLYQVLSIFYLGYILGYDFGDILSRMPLGKSLLLYGGIFLYFLIFLGIVYVLRNQIIRLREFYADLKALEWEGSSGGIIRTLEEGGGVQHSPFEILTKFHPDIKERIEILKNNLPLFSPNIWVGFSIGYFYGIIELTLPMFKEFIFSLSAEQWEAMKYGEVSVATDLNVGLRAAISLMIFTFLMLAVSSSFHRSVLKDFLVEKKQYVSTSTLQSAITFSFAFSLGWLTDTLISFPSIVSLYDFNELIAQITDIGRAFIYHAFYFFLVLVFLLIFASMLIRKSFSKREAMKHFLIVSVAASLLYVIDQFYAVETLNNKYLLVVFFAIFSGIFFVYVKLEGRKLHCPNCNTKLPDRGEFALNCPNCNNQLYSWAIYPSS